MFPSHHHGSSKNWFIINFIIENTKMYKTVACDRGPKTMHVSVPTFLPKKSISFINVSTFPLIITRMGI
jgi:hypothetical protein